MIDIDKDKLLKEVIEELGIKMFPIYQDELMDITDLLIDKLLLKFNDNEH